jgi:hypothetical protein
MPTANKYWPEVRTTRAGSIGHTHALARKGIAKVFELLGGEQGLWAWAMKNDRNKFAFYTILLPKLIPAEIQDAARNGDTKIQVVILPAQEPSVPKHLPQAPEVAATGAGPDKAGGDHRQPGGGM